MIIIFSVRTFVPPTWNPNLYFFLPNLEVTTILELHVFCYWDRQSFPLKPVTNDGCQYGEGWGCSIGLYVGPFKKAIFISCIAWLTLVLSIWLDPDDPSGGLWIGSGIMQNFTLYLMSGNCSYIPPCSSGATHVNPSSWNFNSLAQNI